jgi:hypothetical protein
MRQRVGRDEAAAARRSDDISFEPYVDADVVHASGDRGEADGAQPGGAADYGEKR